ncbi:hypothetical protein VTJ83DRAFT_6115 [Remersonia thermophila]|uniref:Uncharacterized protein n=1 Tax=Remersonia thermophila TaxID=72144 RepID=A0ABR4D8U5_9PEZI
MTETIEQMESSPEHPPPPPYVESTSFTRASSGRERAFSSLPARSPEHTARRRGRDHRRPRTQGTGGRAGGNPQIPESTRTSATDVADGVGMEVDRAAELVQLSEGLIENLSRKIQEQRATVEQQSSQIQDLEQRLRLANEEKERILEELASERQRSWELSESLMDALEGERILRDHLKGTIYARLQGEPRDDTASKRRSFLDMLPWEKYRKAAEDARRAKSKPR